MGGNVVKTVLTVAALATIGWFAAPLMGMSAMAGAFTFGMQGLLMATAKKPKANDIEVPDIGQTQTVIAGQAWVPHVYGRSKVGAIVTDQFVVKDSVTVDSQSGKVTVNSRSYQVAAEGNRATTVYSLSVGEIEKIHQVYYNDTALFVDGTDIQFDTVYSGNELVEKVRGWVEIEFKKGSLNQTASQILTQYVGQVPDDSVNYRYTSTDTGKGVAYCVLTNRKDQYNGFINEASPSSLTFDCSGRKVRDIRQSGSPYVYSSNPALICLEEMRDKKFGSSMPDENIDFYSFAEWADVCEDEGFEMHGRLPQGATLAEIIGICQIHSDSQVIDQNGIVTAKPNINEVGSTSIDITNDNIISAISREEPATSQLYTCAKIQFQTESGSGDLTIRQFDSDTIEKYGYRTTTTQFTMCKSKAMAEKLATRAMLQQLLPKISGTLNLEGYEVSVGDICYIEVAYGDIIPAGSRIKVTDVTKSRVGGDTPVSFTGYLFDDEIFTQQLNEIVVPPTQIVTALSVDFVPTPEVTNTPSVSNDNKIVFLVRNANQGFNLDWEVKEGSEWIPYQGPSAPNSPLVLNLPSRIFLGQVRFRYRNSNNVFGDWYTTGSLDNAAAVPTFNDGANLYKVATDGTKSNISLNVDVTVDQKEIRLILTDTALDSDNESIPVQVRYYKNGAQLVFPDSEASVITWVYGGTTVRTRTVSGTAGDTYNVPGTSILQGGSKPLVIKYSYGGVVVDEKSIVFTKTFKQQLDAGFYSVKYTKGMTVNNSNLTSSWRTEFGYATSVSPPSNTIVNFHTDSDSFYRKWNGTTWAAYDWTLKGDAMIDGTLDVLNAQVGNHIQSLNYVHDSDAGAPSAGWRLTKNGNLYLANGAYLDNLTASSVKVGTINYADSDSEITSGKGVIVNSKGQLAAGDANQSLVWNGSNLYLKGNIIKSGNIITGEVSKNLNLNTSFGLTSITTGSNYESYRASSDVQYSSLLGYFDNYNGGVDISWTDRWFVLGSQDVPLTKSVSEGYDTIVDLRSIGYVFNSGYVYGDVTTATNAATSAKQPRGWQGLESAPDICLIWFDPNKGNQSVFGTQKLLSSGGTDSGIRIHNISVGALDYFNTNGADTNGSAWRATQSLGSTSTRSVVVPNVYGTVVVALRNKASNSFNHATIWRTSSVGSIIPATGGVVAGNVLCMYK